MLPMLAFVGGILFFGFLFPLLWIHLLLSNDSDLKIISFYFPQIPPIVEFFFSFIPLNTWHPPVSAWHLEGKGKSSMPRLNKACSFKVD